MTSWLNDTAVMSAGQIVIAAAAEEAALLKEKAESERVKYEKALRESNLHITQTQEEAQAAVAKLKTLEVELAEARITQVREATRGAEEARQLRLERFHHSSRFHSKNEIIIIHHETAVASSCTSESQGQVKHEARVEHEARSACLTCTPCIMIELSRPSPRPCYRR